MRTDNIRRISVCQISSYRWSFLEDVVRYSNEGFHSIGVWRRKVEDFGTAAAIDLLYESRMSVSSVHWAGGFTGDGQSFAQGIEDTIEAIQMASQMNAGCLIIHPGARNGHTTRHALRLVRSAIRELVPIATDYGVKLVLEPILGQPNQPWSFIESFDTTLELIENYSRRHLGIVLDLHSVGFNSAILEMVDQFVDRVQLVQLADRSLSPEENHRLPLGEGHMPIERWLSKLQQAGYTGQYEVEVHGRAMEGIDYFWLIQSTSEYFNGARINRLIDVQPVSDRRYQLNRDN